MWATSRRDVRNAAEYHVTQLCTQQSTNIHAIYTERQPDIGNRKLRMFYILLIFNFSIDVQRDPKSLLQSLVLYKKYDDD